MAFVVLRDGSGFIQCVLTDRLCQKLRCRYIDRRIVDSDCVWTAGICFRSITGFSARSTSFRRGKTDTHDGHRLVVDYWTLISAAPPGGIDNVLNEEPAGVDTLLDNRQAAFSLTNYAFSGISCFAEKTSRVLRIGAAVTRAMRERTPIITATPRCPIPLGPDPVSATRAEKSRTRRHLSKYNHVEAGVAFVTFEERMDKVEALVCDTVDRLWNDETTKALIQHVHPEFVPPQRRFKRMAYGDAIKWLNEHADYAEQIQSRYQNRSMALCAEDNQLTESVDLLMPGVGKIVGGSYEDLEGRRIQTALTKAGIDGKPYY
ncbi:unnamed protein product, partial [Mesorhabditis spiculigera]